MPLLIVFNEIKSGDEFSNKVSGKIGESGYHAQSIARNFDDFHIQLLVMISPNIHRDSTLLQTLLDSHCPPNLTTAWQSGNYYLYRVDKEMDTQGV